MWQSPGPVFWLGPFLLGLFLIAIGTLIFVFPRLLEYAVATLFIMSGVSLLGVAWNWRGSVSYQRVDERWANVEAHDPPDPPDLTRLD